MEDAGTVTAYVKDDGIDGVIKEDKLGLDKIYVQAKRWNNCVGQPEIQKFVGALVGQGAKKRSVHYDILFLQRSTPIPTKRGY